MRSILLVVGLLVLGAQAHAEAPLKAEPAVGAGTDIADRTIDYDGFSSLTQDLRQYREGRRLTLAQFQEMAARKGVLILDARSARNYERGHIEGAVSLPFTEFTADSLKAAIGDANRPILIYCNNNFANDAEPVPLKSAPLALNIPTFINLYGYGYRNIYELRDVVDFNDPNVRWVRS